MSRKNTSKDKYIELLEKDNLDLVEQNNKLIEHMEETINSIQTNVNISIEDISRIKLKQTDTEALLIDVKQGANRNRIAINDTVNDLISIIAEMKRNADDDKLKARLDEIYSRLLHTTNYEVIGS